jgi:hypothetical protein
MKELDIKIDSVKISLPHPDIDEEIECYNVPYNITAKVNDVKLMLTNRTIFIAPSGSFNDEDNLLSLANSFDFLSEEGKKEFAIRFISKYIGPLLWRRKFSITSKPLSQEEEDILEFCIETLDSLSPGYCTDTYGEKWLNV